jgi:hypothetical protein
MQHDLITETITEYVGAYYACDYDEVRSHALRDSLSQGQLYSKIRALQSVHENIRGSTPFTGYFIGHWHGFLPRIFWKHGLLRCARGVELDPFWVEFSQRLNADWDWQSETGDINTVAHDLGQYNLIVNTSCEHMTDDWLKLPRAGTWVCAQTTDYQHPTHINTCESVQEFQSRFSDYHVFRAYSDQYNVYSRFTIIAIKIK